MARIWVIGDMVLCDGRTIDPAMLTRGASDSDQIFPIEKPMPADFGLWSEALHVLTHQSLKLQSPLGPLVSSPHQPDTWFTTNAGSEFYKVQGGAFMTCIHPGPPPNNLDLVGSTIGKEWPLVPSIWTYVPVLSNLGTVQ